MMIAEHFFSLLTSHVLCIFLRLCTDFANNKCSMIAYIYSKQRIFIITANWNDSEHSNNIIVTLRAYQLKWLSPAHTFIGTKRFCAGWFFLWLQPTAHIHLNKCPPIHINICLILRSLVIVITLHARKNCIHAIAKWLRCMQTRIQPGKNNRSSSNQLWELNTF